MYSVMSGSKVADPWHFGTDRIRGYVPLTNGFGSDSGSLSGSWYFRQ
jgi:hypothetical protein